MTAPLVSIGVPAYNGGRHLVEALESARAQAYAPIEIIVSDDASSDDTETICRHFAAIDARVRYVRQRRNLGAISNFKRVRDLARGTYFTWLAQDDLLSDPRYVGTVVDFLERNPDVVCCMCSVHMLDYELPGTRSLATLPMLSPDSPWAEGRREFFRWPHGDVLIAIYGMFRRAELARIPMITRSYRGRPSSAWWEMPVLAMLTGRGRIVSISTALRTKRSATGSDGWRTYQMSAPFDLFVLGMRTKLLLLRSAWHLPIPHRERAILLELTLQNLFRSNVRRPHDPRSLIDERRRELAVLQRVSRERASLIGSLRREIAERLAILREHSREINVHRDGMGEIDIVERGGTVYGQTFTNRDDLSRALDRYDRSGESLIDFFRPAPEWVLALCQRLNREIGSTRRMCEEQLDTINRLHMQADSILREMFDEHPDPPLLESTFRQAHPDSLHP